MTILFLGDLFGKAGLRILRSRLGTLVDRHRVDFTIANVENAADGFGITPEIAAELLDLGANCLTTGNHAFDRRESVDFFDLEPRLLRPLNYPPGNPGQGVHLGETASGQRVAVLNLMGRVHMPGALDCPFRAADAAIASGLGGARVIIVDMHAEVCSEKAALAWHLDGRVSAVVGTHTHVPTADERIFPGGTAFITDVGMVGPAEGVIGGDRDVAVRRFLTQMPGRIKAASGPARLDGAIIEIDSQTGRSQSIARVNLREIS